MEVLNELANQHRYNKYLATLCEDHHDIRDGTAAQVAAEKTQEKLKQHFSDPSFAGYEYMPILTSQTAMSNMIFLRTQLEQMDVFRTEMRDFTSTTYSE